MLNRTFVLASAALLGGALACDGGGPVQDPPTPACTPAGGVMRLADLPEASGLAVSHTMNGRLWAHNDSGGPELFALDTKGKTTGRVTLSGARVDDWEALAIGPCPAGSCLYVADIGDNGASRPEVTIYRLPEPAEPDGSAKATDVLHASYPDGAHDAETLLVAPDGALFIVTKGDTGPIALYKFPSELQSGATVRLERVGNPISDRPADNARITDGAISRDGQQVVLRTRTALIFYPAADFLRGEFSGGRMRDLSKVGEPQGEAVAFGPGNSVYVAGEGGGGQRPGTLAVVSCPTGPAV